jgi:hypothetical protein
VAGLTSTVDIFASVLEMGGASTPRPTHSRSFVPMMQADGGREAVIYGTFGQGLCCTDGEWTLILPPNRDLPLYAYSTMVPTTIAPGDIPSEHGYFIPGADLPQWKIPISPDGPGDRRALDSEPLLYHRRSDPRQQHNLVSERPEQVERMRTLMRDTLAGYGAPSELFERLSLSGF